MNWMIMQTSQKMNEMVLSSTFKKPKMMYLFIFTTLPQYNIVGKGGEL